ncbi:MAG: leucine-rich repeat domain-containing protein, partial [Muribaculaceae bacterium]|nr:leucine-rich repeat domain-containing protein [Muribaculaceae bacterium]
MNKKILLTLLVALILGATGMRAATNYGINVAGVEVSSSNYNNVTGSKITGSVTYDPTNKILTLTNATISRSDGGDDYGIHNRSVDELTIKIVGSCTVQCAKANALHLDKHTSISITSGSTLNAKMTAGENSGRGVIYVNDVTAYVTGSGTLNVTGTGKTSSYTIAGFEGKSKTGSSNVTLTNIKATINASGHGFYKCKSVTFGTQSDVKIHYSNGYALYETGAMYCNGTVKCVTPSEGTSFNSSSGYFLGGSTYSHFTDDWGVIVNSSNFPDGNFLGVMLGKCSSGEHYLTKSQHQNLTSLDCSSRSISSLTGINLLTYLTTLNCSYNNLTSLNVSSLTRLQTLRCNNNKLPYVYDLPASLQYLYCGGNQFTTWVVNNHSSLKTLDVSNTPTLTSLNCNNNALTSLTISGCTALNTISCDNNQFTSLPTLPSSLETLYCRGNKLTSLPTLPNSLKYLLCDGNNFTTLSLTGYTNLKQLDISNSTSLTKLNCYNNGLTTLNVSGCSALSTLSCYNNYLTTLGTLPSSLKTLYCYTNNLNTLNVSGCTSLTYLDCKANYLTSLGTLPNSLQTI